MGGAYVPSPLMALAIERVKENKTWQRKLTVLSRYLVESLQPWALHNLDNQKTPGIGRNQGHTGPLCQQNGLQPARIYKNPSLLSFSTDSRNKSFFWYIMVSCQMYRTRAHSAPIIWHQTPERSSEGSGKSHCRVLAIGLLALRKTVMIWLLSSPCVWGGTQLYFCMAKLLLDTCDTCLSPLPLFPSAFLQTGLGGACDRTGDLSLPYLLLHKHWT